MATSSSRSPGRRPYLGGTRHGRRRHGLRPGKTQLFNDKEWIVTDNNPALAVLRTDLPDLVEVRVARWRLRLVGDLRGAQRRRRRDWSRPQEISGSNPALCTFQVTGPAGECDENQFSVPTVGPDGTVYVAFENEQNEALWEAAGSSTTSTCWCARPTAASSGRARASWSGSRTGRTTTRSTSTAARRSTGHQLRVNSAGNIVASPTDGTLYLVSPTTGTVSTTSATRYQHRRLRDVLDRTAARHGRPRRRWTPAAGDQWFPWVDVDPIDRQDRRHVPRPRRGNGPLYNTALAEGTPGLAGQDDGEHRAVEPDRLARSSRPARRLREVRHVPRRLHRRLLRERRRRQRRVDRHARLRRKTARSERASRSSSISPGTSLPGQVRLYGTGVTPPVQASTRVGRRAVKSLPGIHKWGAGRALVGTRVD